MVSVLTMPMKFYQSVRNENSVVRSAAAMVVVASQIVLQDQGHLFALLDGLSDEKKNLLTYMIDKNSPQTGEVGFLQRPGVEKLEAEIARLDDRLNPR